MLSHNSAKQYIESGPSFAASHLDYLVSKHIKLPLLSVNAERGAVRFANRGSTHLIV
jgi:hypothetical protein